MNKTTRQYYDVVVIGAGPSGAVAAALLRQKSLAVLVLEKQQFPRFSIGESLLPHCMDFLERADMLDAVYRAGFQNKDGAAFRFDGDTEAFDFGEKSCSGYNRTYQVERARFDQILADEAERQGAEIRYRHGITAFRADNGRTRLEVTTDDGENYEVEAGFVLDGSGFGRVLARLLNLERASGMQTRTSFFTHVADRIAAPGYDRNKILILVHPGRRDVWYWLIPFANGRASVGVILPPDMLASLPDDNLACLREAIGQEPYLAKLLADAAYDSPVGCIEGYSCDVTSLHGDGFALLGNAGEFLDPVFSSGVTIALKSASLAADLVERQLGGARPDWESEYARPLKKGVDTFREFVNAWYDGRLQEIIFADNKSDEIKRFLCSVLAGYAWDPDNPYVQKPGRLDTLAELCRAP